MSNVENVNLKTNNEIINVEGGKFHLEAFDEEFEGYTAGESWNGWECPYFEKNVAEKILSLCIKNDVDLCVYDERDERFIILFDCTIDTKINYHHKLITVSQDKTSNNMIMFLKEIEERCNPSIYNIKKVKAGDKIIDTYAIGNGSWTWKKSNL